MGSKEEEFVVGYNYFLGMDVVLCASPIDGISGIKFDDRNAWNGEVGATEIEINRPGLFGGKEREGGVAGYVDFENGAQDQGINDYLRQVLWRGNYSLAATYGNFADPEHNPALVPAFRGVSRLVFRQFMFGNNPYIKPLRVRARNVYSTFRDRVFDSDLGATVDTPWLPGLAPVCPNYTFQDLALYIPVDNSGSFFSPSAKDENRNAAIKLFLDELAAGVGRNVGLRLQEFDEVVGSSFERIPFTAEDLDEAKEWIDGLPDPNGLTNYNTAYSNYEAFYGRVEAEFIGSETAKNFDSALTSSNAERVGDADVGRSIQAATVLATDGFPTVGNMNDVLDYTDTVPGTQIYCIGVGSTGNLSDVDNTASDGIPLILNDDENFAETLGALLGAPWMRFADLNAAHILRDILINPVFGGAGDLDEIGDSFAVAASTFYTEGMGFSFNLQNPSERGQFKQTVEAHANCTTFLSRQTGKWEIKLIRPDYVLENLTTFDNTIITEWLEWEKPQQFELPNHVTLVYTSRSNGEKLSMSATNNAAIQVVGRLNPTKVEMLGVTCPTLAPKILQRELLSRTNPWGKGRFKVAYLDPALNLGSEIIVNEPRMGIDNVVCRITEIEETDGYDNGIIVSFAEDIYADEITAASAVDVSEDTPDTGFPTTVAQPSSVIFFEEASYFDQILVRGQADFDSQLSADPDIGSFHITGDAFDPFHLTGDIYRSDTSAVWLFAGSANLMPVWTLSAALDSNAGTSVTFTAPATGREYELRAGQIIQIGVERMRLDSVSVASGVATFTVGRGILDTVPASHASGAAVLAWYPYSDSDRTDYTAGDSVDVRFLPKAQGDTVDINDVATQSLYFDSRAIRPYPVGRLKVDGEYTPVDQKSGSVTVTWVHRDRILQTSTGAGAILDHDDSTIGPESGVSYHLVRRWVDAYPSGEETIAYTEETALSPAQTTTTTVDVSDAAFLAYATANTFAMEIGIKSKRTVGSTTYENWQTPFVRVSVATVLTAPYNLTGEPV